MTNMDDTNPVPLREDGDIQAPPRPLLWAVIGLFVLVIVGGFAGLYIFRNVLSQGQQYRVVTLVPFMDAFIPKAPTPEGGIVPTAEPHQGEIDPSSLLTMPLGPEGSTTPVIETTAAVEPPAETTVEPTSASMLPTSTPTPAPTFTPSPTPIPPTPTPAQATDVNVSTTGANVPRRQVSARLGGVRWIQQTWNNCGPANTTMALSYYGWNEDQKYAASYLKPNDRDKNVSPFEITNFINDHTGVRALYRIGGDVNVVKDLIAGGFPVIIESGMMPEAYDWIGHYRTVVGYDDVQGIFFLYDSFLGATAGPDGLAESYDEVDGLWHDFNRVFIVVYKQEDEGKVRDILGSRYDETQAAQIAFNTAQAEANANPQDGFAWFNMGSSLVALGRYDEAQVAYDGAFRVGVPWRILWYQFGPFEAYYQVGRYEDVLAYVNVNLTDGGENVEETYYWMGKVYAAQGNTQEAASAYRQALRHNSLYVEAQQALNALNS